MTTIKVEAGATIGKLQIIECHKYDDNGAEIGYKYIDVKALKDAGVIKRANSFKKAQQFFNTSKGLEFYDKANHMSIKVW
ncbi:hypothetical protein [Priestia megaterium]|uniref:hypothetical protein n=1 Tax=Priestia megaterium TaxID=1404 RepID=UPI000BF7B940|nr:hypothetical protein [Priestia megaterium]PFR93489.1 hypothetical protein COK39_17515 [Priestia megaterium]